MPVPASTQTVLPIPRTIQFSPAPEGAGSLFPPPEFVRFPRVPLPVEARHPTPEDVDSSIARLLHPFARTVEEIDQVTFVVLPHARTAPQHPDILVTLRCDRRQAVFVARANATLAYGYGATIGQALRDALDDFLYRQALLYAEQARLGARLQKERAGLAALYAGSA
jgi:hypothetical protein